jgi:hypothetical protein
MPISGQEMIDALYSKAVSVVGQTITKGEFSIVIEEVKSLIGPLFHPIPISAGSRALATRLTLTVSGVDRITPVYVKEVVDGVPIFDDWWCVLFAHEIPDMNNSQQIEYLKDRLIAFSESGPI